MLLNKQNRNSGPIVVTGATGAVGSMSINILNNIGFDTIAITRKNTSIKYLKSIGAKEIIRFNKNINKKVLDKEIFAGSIDNVGGEILDWIIKSTKNNGNIVSVGMASSSKLNTTIFPLIMRSVNLLGVSSTNYPHNRKNIWEKLSTKYKPDKLDIINTKCIKLENVVNLSEKIISGKNIGKIVIKIS
jgi:putative YhdH/YhfP family quinone oxidoreductase